MMRRIRVVLAVLVVMALSVATLLVMSASPALADHNCIGVGEGGDCIGVERGGFFDSGFHHIDDFFLFPTFGFAPFFDDRVVFEDVDFRNVRENAPRDDTCVLRADGFFRDANGLVCFF